MAKDDARKFVELVQSDPAMRARAEQAMAKLGHGGWNIEKVFHESLVPMAQEMGLEFTLEELQNPSEGQLLTDDELDKAVGGITDSDGHWLTTVGFSCEKWRGRGAGNITFGVDGTCGSCVNWDCSQVLMFIYVGVPGKCWGRRN